MNIKEACFAGGCFWCITPTFNETDGVDKVISGFSGGDEVDPSYEEVKAQKTGHREAVKIIYDADKVSYEELMEIYLGGVDPFDDGGQFIDRGHSYTLAIFYKDESEKKIAEERIASIEKQFNKKVYISVEEYKNFYTAAEYHQNFYLKNPEAFEKELIESGRKKPD